MNSRNGNFGRQDRNEGFRHREADRFSTSTWSDRPERQFRGDRNQNDSFSSSSSSSGMYGSDYGNEYSDMDPNHNQRSYGSDNTRYGSPSQTRHESQMDSYRSPNFDRNRHYDSDYMNQSRSGFNEASYQDLGSAARGTQSRDDWSGSRFGGSNSSYSNPASQSFNPGSSYGYGSPSSGNESSSGRFNQGFGGQQFGGQQYGGQFGNQQAGGQQFGSQGYGSSQQFGSQSYGSQSSQYSGKGPKGYRRTDERIREDVCETLSRHHEIDASEVEVNVQEGMVTLTGTVEQRHMKRMIEDAIENLSGVQDVKNEIRVQSSNFSSSSSSTSSNSMSGTGATRSSMGNSMSTGKSGSDSTRSNK